MRQSTLQVLSQKARELSIPLIYTHSIGFYCSLSLQLPAIFPIVETHPDPETTQDLRLTAPWPELLDAAKRIEHLDSLDDHQHGHVPYLLLLLHYLEIWKQGHGGLYPQNYKEKTAFKEMVRGGARSNNPEGGEENFDEAVAAVLRSINPWSLSSGLREIFEMDECCNLNGKSDDFWVITHAIKAFHQQHGVLPLPGTVPDMKAQSADYIALQNLYKSKARQDLAEVVAKVRSTEAQLGTERAASEIPAKEVEVFCKNAAHIKLIKGREIPFLTVEAPHSETVKTIRDSLGNPESLISIFIALRALGILVTEYQENMTDSAASSFLDDSVNWQRAVSQILQALQVNGLEPLDDEARANIENAVTEVRRAGAGELHNISSMAGGFVAQEALKVLTKQYVPLDNTFVFDGVRSKGEMFRL